MIHSVLLGEWMCVVLWKLASRSENICLYIGFPQMISKVLCKLQGQRLINIQVYILFSVKWMDLATFIKLL